MKKFNLLIILATAVILVSGVFLVSKAGSPPPLPTAYEYFWKEGCPHCKNVESFLEGWEKKGKVQINKIDVGGSSQNARLLSQRADYCKIPAAEVGVPLLFTPNGKCVGGDEPIINFFKNLNL